MRAWERSKTNGQRHLQHQQQTTTHPHPALLWGVGADLTGPRALPTLPALLEHPHLLASTGFVVGWCQVNRTSDKRTS